MATLRHPELVRLLKLAGGPTALARRIFITPEAVMQWERVPATRVMACCEAVGWRMLPHQLRPDVCPPPRITQTRKFGAPRRSGLKSGAKN